MAIEGSCGRTRTWRAGALMAVLKRPRVPGQHAIGHVCMDQKHQTQGQEKGAKQQDGFVARLG